ncbi:hypothetical protein GCM10011324_25410 [Allosediminivita pacifica]|nr:hypothetical protein GCM10011324_25410 [Allosediminivita pacifica]
MKLSTPLSSRPRTAPLSVSATGCAMASPAEHATPVIAISIAFLIKHTPSSDRQGAAPRKINHTLPRQNRQQKPPTSGARERQHYSQ